MFAAEGAVFPTPVYTACTQTDINTHGCQCQEGGRAVTQRRGNLVLFLMFRTESHRCDLHSCSRYHILCSISAAVFLQF